MKRCYGCSACVNICPKQAIKMEENEEGFLYPVINQEKCINCGMCNDVCIINKKNKKEKYEQKVYAVKHKNIDELLMSSSGAMFAVLSNYVLSLDGKIYGAIFDKNKKAVYHIGAENKEDRDKMRGSKYVQSDLNNTFKQIRKDLEESKYVLFTGTPCQVMGLKRYLNSVNQDKLFLCDILCHGVPSPKIFKEYITFIENKNKTNIDRVEFKNKKISWKAPLAYLYSKNKKYSLLYYTNIFYSKLAFRPSCYECQFANTDRVGDITIGDFWGIEKVMPDFYNNKGVSVAILNTQKGEKLFNNIKNFIEFRKSNLHDCIQPNLIRPEKKPENREKFWKDYKNQSFETILKRYGNYNNLKYIIKYKIKNFIKKIIKL